MKPRKRDQRRKQRDQFERAYSEQYPVTVLTTADLFERAPTGDYTRTPTQVGWRMWQAALASRDEVAQQPSLTPEVDADCRQTVIWSLMASKSWTRGYAESYVDAWLDGRAAQQPQVQSVSDEQIEALAHRTCSRYRHDTHPSYVEYVFQRHTLGDFVRAILALRDKPATASDGTPSNAV